MNKKIFALTICSIFAFSFLGFARDLRVTKPAVARIASYIEGIVDMKVAQGQHVKKGELLFSIETDFLKTVKNKCANAVWYYTETYKRLKGLHKIHSESTENLQDAEYDLMNAVGDLKKEQLLIDHWADYYAPFDGVVTRIYYYSGSGAPDASGDPETDHAVLEVMKSEDYNKLKAEGVIDSIPTEANISSMVEGIVDMKVKLGDKVKKGQILFTIDMDYNRIIRAQQKANLKLCKAKYERQKRLYKENANALRDYQTAEFNYKNAIQDLEASNIIINKRSIYKAPFDGIVSDIIYYTGSNTFAGHKVLEITKE